MICRVKYLNESAKAYCGASYTYRTELPLKVNDKVLVPVKESEKKKAIVVTVDLPESVIDKEWADRVKFIKEYDNE